jgi:hypothetical protein
VADVAKVGKMSVQKVETVMYNLNTKQAAYGVYILLVAISVVSVYIVSKSHSDSHCHLPHWHKQLEQGW